MSESIIIVGEIHSVESIAVGHGILELAQLRNRYGDGNWRKKKGVTKVELPSIFGAPCHFIPSSQPSPGGRRRY